MATWKCYKVSEKPVKVPRKIIFPKPKCETIVVKRVVRVIDPCYDPCEIFIEC